MPVVRVTSKGQATIPKELRDRFGIPAPGKVVVREEEGRIIIEPVRKPSEMMEHYAKLFRGGPTSRELMAEADRVEREAEARHERASRSRCARRRR